MAYPRNEKHGKPTVLDLLHPQLSKCVRVIRHTMRRTCKGMLRGLPRCVVSGIVIRILGGLLSSVISGTLRCILSIRLIASCKGTLKASL